MKGDLVEFGILGGDAFRDVKTCQEVNTFIPMLSHFIVEY